MLETFLLAFATFFVLIDPILFGTMSLALLDHIPDKKRAGYIIRSNVYAFIILITFGFFGETLLRVVGISIPAFRISGGILLLLTALEILFGKRNSRREKLGEPDIEHEDPSLYPLAFPLMAGPGAITTIILFINEMDGAFWGIALIILALSLVLLLSVASGVLINRYHHLVGQNGVAAVIRILGLLTAAIAVQFIADGIVGYIQAIE